MGQLAEEFNLYISRYGIENEYEFFILNQPVQPECFYEENAFEYDLSVKVSDTFDSRSNAFIQALDKSEFNHFKNLNWSNSKVLYFTVS